MMSLLVAAYILGGLVVAYAHQRGYMVTLPPVSNGFERWGRRFGLCLIGVFWPIGIALVFHSRHKSPKTHKSP